MSFIENVQVFATGNRNSRLKVAGSVDTSCINGVNVSVFDKFLEHRQLNVTLTINVIWQACCCCLSQECSMGFQVVLYEI